MNLLPDREEQDKLAELLWAIEENIEAYNKLISYGWINYSQFIEIFGNPVELIGNYEFKDVLEDQTRLGTKIKKVIINFKVNIQLLINRKSLFQDILTMMMVFTKMLLQ